MKIYRKLNPIKVLSFDLDDTLYDNKPVIKAAIAAQIDYINNIPIWGKKWQQQPGDFWAFCRDQLKQQQPLITNDVTQWRLQALKWGFQYIGMSDSEATHHAEQAFAVFIQARSQVTVAPEVLSLLALLREKYTVIAITNGNVDVSKFCLRDSFDFVLMAGFDGPQKPAAEMFHLAADKLNMELRHILHIGDSLDSDIQGANNAGCMSCWLNEQPMRTAYKGLTDIEISDIQQLSLLL